MTQAKHTPAPWFIEHHEWAQKGHVFISAKDHEELAQVVWLMEDDEIMGRNSPIQEANARLIAAAPEQNAALIGLIQLVEELDCLAAANDPRAKAARYAITKATGETQ